jgi:myo-inositol-1(or 4)-monophosphatase
MRLEEDLELRRRVAEEAARAAGEVHLRSAGQALERDIHHGNRVDYSTRVDREAQEAVRQVLARYFPQEPLFGEEDVEGPVDLRREVESGCWLTDPLDGTLEYVHGGPMYSAIVTYVREGQPQACAVFFTALDEMFSAALGEGATLNAAPIRASGTTELRSAVFATALRAASPDKARAFGDRAAMLLPLVEGLRLPGPPSVGACYVACGRYDVSAAPRFIQNLPAETERPQPWETAAFILLVQEAGGHVRALDGGPPDVLGYNAYAATPELLREFLTLASAPP